MLSPLRNRIDILRSAYSSWSAILGTIIAIIALCNMIFRVIRVSPIEALSLVLSAYQKTFHPPIDYVFSIFSIHIPAPGKDLLVLYLAVGGILYRTMSYERSSALKSAFPRTWRSAVRDVRVRINTVVAAIIWPYFLPGFIRNPCLLVESQKGYHGRLPPPRRDLPAAERQDVIEFFLNQLGDGARVICSERQLFALYAVGLLVAVICLVILNAAIDGLSESVAH